MSVTNFIPGHLYIYKGHDNKFFFLILNIISTTDPTAPSIKQTKCQVYAGNKNMPMRVREWWLAHENFEEIE